MERMEEINARLFQNPDEKEEFWLKIASTFLRVETFLREVKRGIWVGLQ